MLFKHVPDLNFPELEVQARENGRFYVTPEGKAYPSVTTVLGHGSDKSWLEEWKKRVGEKEAARISAQASRRGTAVHEIAEKYLRNDPNYLKGQMPSNIASFKSIQKFLDDHVGLVAGIEVPLYSDFLRVAGRVDLVAKWNSIWSIIDFKTSRKEKFRDDIHHYFAQEACYGYMFYERTGKPIPQIVTVMMIDDSVSKVFVERTKNHLQTFIDIRNKVEL